jgi:hypothetical protein
VKKEKKKLPEKNEVQLLLFDYEGWVYREVCNSKNLWTNKASGLGIAEFMLRYICMALSERRQAQGLQDMHHNSMILRYSLEVIPCLLC